MSACANCGGELPAAAAFCPTCGRAIAAATRPVETVRRTITVVFCDLSGSTALGEFRDPELMRSVVTRYFAAVSAVMEQHGGTVEKFIGDAVMTVFGVPELHEDDAVRAVRAAVGARDAVDQLNEQLERDHALRIAVRLGVETGEVVVGDGSRGTVATGDAVNVAARLEQAAAPGDIVIGPGTWRLVREVAHAEAVGPLSVHGKHERVPAWRLLGVDPEQPRHMADTPFIGRTRELSLLRQIFERCSVDRACHLVTLLGVAGVGKTRLLSELLATLAEDVVVLRGRCLSYGNAVGLWPVREVLRSAAGLSGSLDEGDARRRIARVVADDPDPTTLADRVAALAGLGGTMPSREETPWVIRRFLELLGESAPLLVVIDDLHWADPHLLDVIDNLADWVRDTPLLLVCVSRPELLDARPTWGGGRVNATSLLLSPLDANATTSLVQAIAGSHQLAPDVAQRVCDAAAGVPLYAEHLIAMLIEDDQLALRDGVWSWTRPPAALGTPPSIAAILAARLDQLDGGQRAVIESAAVVGDVFYRGAVAELSAAADADAALSALVRRDLVRPERSDIPGEEALRFTHVLIRDAAYNGMSKMRRSDLHLRLARWLEKRSQTIATVGPFVGHHLAQAVLLRDALGPRDASTRDLATEAVDILMQAARELEVTDPRASAAIIDRAAEVCDDPSQVARIRLRQSYLYFAGEDIASQAQAWRAARDAAERAGDPRLLRLAQLEGSILAGQLPTSGATPMSTENIEEAVREFRELGDDEGLILALRCLAERLTEHEQWQRFLDICDESVTVAERMGDEVARAVSQMWAVGACAFSPLHAEQALERLDRARSDPSMARRDLQVRLGLTRIPLLAMLDRAEDARRAAAELHREVDELHSGYEILAFMAGRGMAIIGDFAAAEAHMRPAVELLTRIGEVGWLSTLLCGLGEVRLAMSDEDDARRCAETAREISPPSDNASQAGWRALLAALEAREGRLEPALRLADEAVDWAYRGDQIDNIADRHRRRAEVRLLAGMRDEARADLEEAMQLYRRKGSVPAQRRVQELLDVLQP